MTADKAQSLKAHIEITWTGPTDSTCDNSEVVFSDIKPSCDDDNDEDDDGVDDDW